MFHSAYQKIKTKEATIAIIGLGYVGLPNLVSMATKGYSVIGLDVNLEKLAQLKQGISYIADVDNQAIQTLLDKKKVRFESDFSYLKEADVIFIDVPTPIDCHKIPDISFVEAAANSVLKNLQPGQLIVLESTVFPTVTQQYLITKLEQLGLVIGQDVFVAYSPERINPGTTTLPTVAKVVGGATDNCSRLTSLVLGDNTHIVANPTTAELAKLHENTFRFVNIALANELTKVCSELAINPFEVIEASNSKPFGFMKFTPSVGVGGHCISVDPYYLSWYMKDFPTTTPLIEVAGQINDSMIQHTVKRIIQQLTLHQVPLYNAQISIIGATYKQNVPDTRMTPVNELVAELATYAITCHVYDDLVATDDEQQPLVPIKKMDYPALKEHDLSLLLVAHDYLDYQAIRDYSSLIIDTQNVYVGQSDPTISTI